MVVNLSRRDVVPAAQVPASSNQEMGVLSFNLSAWVWVREGCKKSKWKFKMAFAMKGGGLEGVSFAIKLF